MKRAANMMVLSLIVALTLTLAVGVAMSADTLIDSKVTAVKVATDKNGNEYVRLIIPEQRKMNGVEYTVGVAVMAFSDMAPQVKNLKPGDTLKAICASKEYKGRTSYTILALVQ